MACPGGCVGGSGTLLLTLKGETKVKIFSEQSLCKTAQDNPKIKK
jgi:iron only hydrogenase large subunit-like protein